MKGNVRIRGMQRNPLKEELGAIRNGDIAAWKYLDFGSGASRMSVRVKSELGGEIIVRADAMDGDVLGTFTVPYRLVYIRRIETSCRRQLSYPIRYFPIFGIFCRITDTTAVRTNVTIAAPMISTGVVQNPRMPFSPVPSRSLNHPDIGIRMIM